jgi:hypothetical protein
MSEQVNSQFYFIIETLEIDNGKRLRALKPDEYGYYEVPAAVLGGLTREEFNYDPSCFFNCITSPQSKFNILLKEGNLYGEYGHPFDADIPRAMTIDEKMVSHHFSKVYAGPQISSGGRLILTKIKPFGPYKNELKDSLEDPKVNTALSLRAICEQRIDYATKVITRFMKYLVTFDYVFGSGYKEASKRYSPAMENISFKITKQDFYKDENMTVCYENISDKDVLDIFGAKEMIIKTQTKAIRFDGSNTIFDETGNKTSLLYTSLMK